MAEDRIDLDLTQNFLLQKKKIVPYYWLLV